jgi:hypothetical protein
MKVKTLSALAGLGGALIMTTSASASYQGLSVVSSLGAPLGRITYRVYANFSDANDYLTVVNGSPTGSTMTIQSTLLNGTGVGSAFFNPVTSHGTAPNAVEVFGGTDPSTNPILPVPNAAFDTFFTIGVGAGQSGTGAGGANDTGQSPTMPNNFITGTSISLNNDGWFTAGPVEQGRAGWLGDGDAQLRVLMMQLTVSSTSGVAGTVNIAGVNNTGLAGGTSFVLSNQTFTSFVVPGPGAMALLGIAGLVGSRRRRA